MRRNSRILDVFTQLASRLRMHPTVIGPRANASYALGRSAIARTVVELSRLNREPPEGGIEREYESGFAISGRGGI